MFVLIRAVTYATVFIGFVLIALPSRILSAAGVTAPPVRGLPQVAGLIIGTLGGLLVVWCVLTFATVGQGTPAPFDPPRRLVVRGPYRVIRNPMYVGAAFLLGGAALFYRSAGLLAYVASFLLVLHVFVVLYEEPTLRRTFGDDYRAYCARVGRWWPRLRTEEQHGGRTAAGRS